MLALYPYTLKLPWLKLCKGIEHRWYEWLEMHHAVG